MIVRFSGESVWDSIVNHFCLDIVDEDLFKTFVESRGYTIESSLEVLESLYEEFVSAV